MTTAALVLYSLGFLLELYGVCDLINRAKQVRAGHAQARTGIESWIRTNALTTPELLRQRLDALDLSDLVVGRPLFALASGITVGFAGNLFSLYS